MIRIVPDWITWANSPPRPIPALHGPLSLPYARCPSGAEGTIIEEPDNVAQMIWGLGPDDQTHNQFRVEGQVPPRLQKKRMPSAQQVAKSSRTQTSIHMSHAKQSFARTQRQAHDDKRSPLSQVPPDIEAHQDIVNGLPWNEEQSMPTSVGVPDNFLSDTDVFSVDNNRILEWQLARLRQALRTSLADVDSYSGYPGRLEPVIPTAVAPGLPQFLPSSATRQSPIEVAQQYRHQQLYRQALQKQKFQVQNFLPTPPNSSSPQWSSHFSPYLTYCSTFSPELVGSTEHPVPVPSQKYRSGANASQYLRHVYDGHEHGNVNNFDKSTNISPAKTPLVPNVKSTASLRQSSSSSTLAKYINQLQALSPIAHFSPLQPVPPPNISLSQLPSADESTVGSFRGVYHSSVVPTPPSPESPQTLSRGASHNARSIPPTRPMQRHLSSVPEEDSALLGAFDVYIPTQVTKPGHD
ncbi:hypothetical protein J3R82DRAFT_10442 [Butyriboletus roseoflavus]|nr:hypothetical protein J3R82DRAFT_10442 [Butyriboletus roseoflavus]